VALPSLTRGYLTTLAGSQYEIVGSPSIGKIDVLQNVGVSALRIGFDTKKSTLSLGERVLVLLPGDFMRIKSGGYLTFFDAAEVCLMSWDDASHYIGANPGFFR